MSSSLEDNRRAFAQPAAFGATTNDADFGSCRDVDPIHWPPLARNASFLRTEGLQYLRAVSEFTEATLHPHAIDPLRNGRTSSISPGHAIALTLVRPPFLTSQPVIFLRRRQSACKLVGRMPRYYNLLPPRGLLQFYPYNDWSCGVPNKP